MSNSRRSANSSRLISMTRFQCRCCRRNWRRWGAVSPREVAMTRLTAFVAGAFALLCAAVLTPMAVQAQSLDLDQVFRCSATDDAGTANCREARDLILNNCTVCHTFVPIVMQQFDTNGWTSLLNRHVGG